MKKMDKKAITMAFEETVFWGRAVLVLVILIAMIILFWDKLNNWLTFIKGFR